MVGLKHSGSVRLRTLIIPQDSADRHQLHPVPSVPHHLGMAFAVTLSTLDFLDATDVAVARMRASTKRSLCHANVRQRTLTTRLYNDVLGAASELAVARWLGVPWLRSVNTFHDQADVGEDVDVRSTDRREGSLILRDNDPPYRWFVLVTGVPPALSLNGYIWGADAMAPRWWRNAHGTSGAWFVPQSELIPIQPDGIVPLCLRQSATLTMPVGQGVSLLTDRLR